MCRFVFFKITFPSITDSIRLIAKFVQGLIIFLQIKSILKLIESYQATNDNTQEDPFLHLVIPLRCLSKRIS